MLFDVSIIGLLLFCVQQLGVALGLGGQSAYLAAHLIAIGDGGIDPKEAQFERAAHRVLNAGLVCIVVSGVLITLLHGLSGEMSTVLEPAYLFKLALIALAVTLSILSYTRAESLMLGLAGGTWYALFVVHILAPVTGWMDLLVLYAIWMAGFNLVWGALVHSKKGKSAALSPSVSSAIAGKLLEQKIIPPTPITRSNEMPKKAYVMPQPPAPPPQPVIPAPPPPKPAPLIAGPLMPKKIVAPQPTVDLNTINGLPPLRVMPQAAPKP